MASIIYANIGIKEPTHEYLNSDTKQILVFDGYIIDILIMCLFDDLLQVYAKISLIIAIIMKQLSLLKLMSSHPL